MTRRVRPTGGGGARHPASLANLRNAPVPPAGNQRARRHGGYSEALVADVEREVREVMDALAEAAPVRGPDGELPAADVAAVEVAARALRRYRTVAGWCDQYGRLDERTGAAKPAAALELETERALCRALGELGLTPMSRSKLGVALARMADLSTAMSEPDPSRRARMMAEAGVPVDGEAEEDPGD